MAIGVSCRLLIGSGCSWALTLVLALVVTLWPASHVRIRGLRVSKLQRCQSTCHVGTSHSSQALRVLLDVRDWLSAYALARIIIIKGKDERDCDQGVC